VGGGLQPGAALVVVCLAIVTLQSRSTAPTLAGCCLVACCVVSGLSLRSQSRCGGGITARLRRPGVRSGLPCPVPVCCCRGRLAGAVPIAGNFLARKKKRWRHLCGFEEQSNSRHGISRGECGPWQNAVHAAHGMVVQRAPQRLRHRADCNARVGRAQRL
jgi:hypothetical protein